MKIPPPSPKLDLQLGLEAKLIRSSLKPALYFWGESKSFIPAVTPLTTQRFLVEEIGHMSLPLTAILVYAIVRMFMLGINLELLFLSVGSILSVLTAFIVSMHIIGSHKWVELKGTKRKVMIMTLVGFFPFLFGLYLIFFKGIYLLIVDFSLARVFKSLMFIWLGHWVIKKIRMIQEFHSEVYGQVYDGYMNPL